MATGPTDPASTRPARRIGAFAETRSLTGWARDPRCRVSPQALAWRLKAGWNSERAITQPDRFLLAKVRAASRRCPLPEPDPEWRRRMMSFLRCYPPHDDDVTDGANVHGKDRR